MGTYIRINTANVENAWLVFGMNRLRRAYLEIAPSWSPMSSPDITTTSRGVLQTFGPDAVSATRGLARLRRVLVPRIPRAAGDDAQGGRVAEQ